MTRRTDVNGQSQEPDFGPGQQRLQPVKSQQETQQPFELPATDSAQESPGHEVVDGRYRAEVQG